MERHFIQELDRLKMSLLDMAAITRRSLGKAAKAYIDRDESLARSVIDGDCKINEMETRIDQISLKMLALEQPLARDLRFILGATKISNELERIADQSVNIAERTLFLCQHPPLDPIPAMDRLIDVSQAMLEKAISSIVQEDVDLALQVREMDDLADGYTLEVLSEMIEHMVQSTPTTERRRLNTRRSIITIIISRCLERVADLSTNIGEHVAFIVGGINVKHQPVKK